MAINIDYTGQLAKGALEQMNKTREQSFQQQGIDTQNRYAAVNEKTFDFNKAQKEKEQFQGQFKTALDQAIGILNSTTDPTRRQAVMQTIQQLGQVYTGPVAQQYGLAETNAKMIEFALQNPTVQEQGAAAGTMQGTTQQANFQTLADAGQPTANAQQGAGIYVAPVGVGSRGGAGGSGKPLPAAVSRLQQESLDVIGVASGMNSKLQEKIDQITAGDLKLGPVSNVVGAGLNKAGMSTENSRNVQSFKSDLEKLRNDSLRLNKGVQTEGDAIRAWNEILVNINDEEYVKQRLAEIQVLNARAAELQKLNVEQLRSDYGLDPIDFTSYESLGGVVASPPAATPAESAPAKAKFLGFE